MALGEVKIHGLRELNAALHRYNRALGKELDKSLREGANIVRDSARNKFSVVDTKSAAGYQTRMRGYGRVVVQQRYGPTTGLRPDFGSLQMRKALLPARYEEEPRVVGFIEEMLNMLGREEGF